MYIELLSCINSCTKFFFPNPDSKKKNTYFSFYASSMCLIVYVCMSHPDSLSCQMFNTIPVSRSLFFLVLDSNQLNFIEFQKTEFLALCSQPPTKMLGCNFLPNLTPASFLAHVWKGTKTRLPKGGKNHWGGLCGQLRELHDLNAVQAKDINIGLFSFLTSSLTGRTQHCWETIME